MFEDDRVLYECETDTCTVATYHDHPGAACPACGAPGTEQPT
jgi:rubrerythrin